MEFVRKWFLLLPMVLLLLCYCNFSAAADPAAAPALPGIAAKCNECHELAVSRFEGSHHAKAWVGSDRTCTNCHGNADTHMSAGDGKNIISFKTKDKELREGLAAQCLTCHNTTAHLAMWNIGDHKKNGVTCVDCHNIHVPATQRIPTSETCLKCHKQVENDLRKQSHHPILEGKVGCKDCHNPHGTTNKHQLKAPTTNLLCYKCHTNKRGPFKWEHPPVEEDCLICHNAHGSRNDRLLKKKLPSLCIDCHANRSGSGTVFGHEDGLNTYSAGRGCAGCHSKLHGDNNAAKGKTFVY